MPKTIKQVKRLIGFSQFFRNYMPELGTKLMPFYYLLMKDRELVTTEKHRKKLATIKQQDLLRATGITLRLPKPRQQHVILCNASYHGSVFVLMVGDYVKENNSTEKKTYLPLSFGSWLFASPQLKFSVFYKEFLALYFPLDHFPNYIWVNTKPVIFFPGKINATTFGIFLTEFWCSILQSHMFQERQIMRRIFFHEKEPVREIQIQSEAETPDVPLNTIEKIVDSFKEDGESDLATQKNW